MFDFSKALQDAQAATEQSNSGNKFQHKLIYPQEGTLQCRILFNPKSNSIIRRIIRHQVGNNKIPCMMNFGHNKSDCPICNAANNVYNTNGSVPKGLWAQTRGLCFIQYIGSSYKIEGINPGEIALLMVPKTMYEEIQSWIMNITSGDQGVQAMYEVFCRCQCMEQTISRTSDNKYSFMMNPYKKFQSAPTDDDWSKILDNLPDLNEQLVPAVLTDEVMKTIKAGEESIDQTYLNAKIPAAPQIPQAPTGFTGGYVANTPSAPAAQMPTGTATPANFNTNPTQAQVNTDGASNTAVPAVKPKPCFGTYQKLQTNTDPVSVALKGLCSTCSYIDQCKAAEGV